MPFGFGKRGRESVPSSEDDYYGEDDGYNDHGVYNGPPPDAFQHGHTGNEFQDGGEDVEEDYGFGGGSQEEGRFAGVSTTAGQLSEEQRQQLQESKVGLTAAERLAMINDTANINSYQTSIKQKKRQNCCMRCYLVIILAVIGLVVGLYFAFGGPGSDSATNTFREAWRPPSPTPRPTRVPTIRPSASPSVTASNNPSALPTVKPTVMASDGPSAIPTSSRPSPLPSMMETESPSLVPSSSQPTTMAPTTAAPVAPGGDTETDVGESDETTAPQVDNNQTDAVNNGTENNTTAGGNTTDASTGVDTGNEDGAGESSATGEGTDTTVNEPGGNDQSDSQNGSNAVEGEVNNGDDPTGGGNDSSIGGGNSGESTNDTQEDGSSGGGQAADDGNGDQGTASDGGSSGGTDSNVDSNTEEDDTHQQEGHGDGDDVQGDNIFKESSPIVDIECDEGTEIVSIYMADAIGDGWEGAQLAVIEDGDADGSQPIFKDTLARNEKARGESLCLNVDTCYRIVVDGGMWMNEIRWGIGHSTVKTENTTIFMARDADLIESKATWLAPADCSFSLYGACSNSCKSGYGENPPTLDENGNVIEKGSEQGHSSGGQTKVVNATAQVATDENPLASAAPIASPNTTSALVSANSVLSSDPDSNLSPTTKPTTPQPSSSPISDPPTQSPVEPPTQQTMPGSPLSAGVTDNLDDSLVGEPMSWSYYSYSYSCYSYERKARRGRERRIQQKRRIGRQK